MRLLGNNTISANMLDEWVSRYENKSEEEIMIEIEKFKKDFQQNPEKYRKHMEALEQLKVILDEDRRKKLEKWIQYFNLEN